MQYLTKKYGDKEQDHRTLVRQLSHATEKVMGDDRLPLNNHCFELPRLRRWKSKIKIKCWLMQTHMNDYKKVHALCVVCELDANGCSCCV